MKKLLILTFVIGIFFPSISNASCKDDYSKSWKFSGSDAIEIRAENNTNRKIILTNFDILTASGEIMKSIPLNKTLEPYGIFEKYIFHKLNKKLIKLGRWSCKYHPSVGEKKRKEEAIWNNWKKETEKYTQEKSKENKSSMFSKKPDKKTEIEKRLEELKQLLDKNIISKEEYEEQRKKIIGDL